MVDTTIKIKEETKDKLFSLKIHPREPFNDVIERLLNNIKKLKGGYS